MKLLFLTLAISLCASWSGSAELLYWKPTICPVPYATGINGSAITEFDMLPDMGWGGRGAVGWNCISVNYLYNRSVSRARIGGDRFGFLEITTVTGDNPVARVSSRLALRYQVADVTAKYSYFLVRAGWVGLDYDLRAEGPATNVVYTRRVALRTQSQGAILGVGAEVCQPLWWGITGEAKALCSLSLMNAKVKEHIALVSPTANHRTPVSRAFRCMPAFEARLGLRWFCLRLAYELHHYMDTLIYSSDPEGDGDQLMIPTCMNVGFAGPTLGASLCF